MSNTIKLTNKPFQSLTAENGKNIPIGGYTFTPAVSAEGVISWTNDGDLENPTPVNIKGNKGDKGDRGFSGVYVGTGDMPSDCNVQIDPSGTTTEVDDLKNELDDIVSVNRSVNKFDKNSILEGKYYKHVNGVLSTGDATGYVCFLLEVEKGKYVYTVSGTSYASYLVDKDMNYLGYSYKTGTKKIDFTAAKIKDKVKYIAISFRTTSWSLDSYMAVEGTEMPSEYVPFFESYKELKNIKVPSILIPDAPKKYVIKKDGSGDYPTFTSCIKALKDDNSEKYIYIESGIYDIFSEIGGSEYALGIPSDAVNWRLYNDIIPPNTNVIGLGNVVFNFNPSSDEINSLSASLLSPINVSGNVSIENITVNADNCRYCIHDDTGGISDFNRSHHRYKNVFLNKKRTSYGIECAFGCGFNFGAVFDFDGCVFNSNDRAISMHNRPCVEDNTLISIRNSAFISKLRAVNLRNVNPYQTKIDVNIFNSYIGGTIVVQNETTTERPNAFDVSLFGCGDKTVTVENAVNIYTPKVYNY